MALHPAYMIYPLLNHMTNHQLGDQVWVKHHPKETLGPSHCDPDFSHCRHTHLKLVSDRRFVTDAGRR